MKIWTALCALEGDPHPEVQTMCKTIIKHIHNLVKESRDFVDNKCASLPPSPNRASYLSGESPPTLHPSSDIQKFARDMTNRRRKIHPNIISEESDEKVRFRKALVSTNFIEWSCRRFSQSATRQSKLNDAESLLYHEKDWRYIR